MTKVDDWLAGIPSKSTRKSYINGLKTFEGFFGKGVETLIGNKNAGKSIEKFFSWMKEKGLAQNTARVKANAVIQFLKYFDTPVKYRKSIGIYRTEISTRDHRLTVSELPSDPERITLGTPRGLAKTLIFAKDRSWEKIAFTDNPERTGWGKKAPVQLRKEIYTFFYDKLASLGFDKNHISICKETRAMWKEMNLNPDSCKCNCVW